MKLFVVSVQLALCAFFGFVRNAALSPIDSNFGFTEEEVKALREGFNSMDQDGDGTLNIDDVRKMLDLLGDNPTDEELKKMIAEVDTDGNGKIEFNEFLQLMEENVKAAEEELKRSFQGFDKDGDGFISSDELRQVVIEIGHKPSDSLVEKLIKVADRDGDGKVNFEEFKMVLNVFK